VNKSELRQQIKSRFTDYSKVQLADKSKAIAKNLNRLLSQLKSEHQFSTLGVYSPLRDEPIWWQGFDGAYELLLVHIKDETDLSFHPVPLEVIQSFSGTLELPEIYLKTERTPEVLLVPGLGFTRSCDRLGRGKGFYDRYLERFSGVRVGIAFSLQVLDRLPKEEHDQALDYLVTDEDIYRKEK
jgi:5-formyltetrahydrofolate cyclo-ligase